MSWVLIRTDARKEAYVARRIERLGLSAWVPAQIIASRPQIARRLTSKAHLTSIKEIPILPRRVFALAPAWDIPEMAFIRHYAGIERTIEGRFVYISDEQVIAFRAAIEQENTATLALASRPNQKQKAKWRSLKEGLLEAIEAAKTQMEIAA